MQTIYLVLTGEDKGRRSRSNKLLQLIKKSNNEEYTIVVSGYSTFGKRLDQSEAAALAEYLVQHDIPEQQIILEEQSLDTLGNVVFSYDIIEGLLLNESTAQQLVLITDRYHMHRAKRFFELVYVSLFEQYPNISVVYASANTIQNSWRHCKNIVGKLWYKARHRMSIRRDVMSSLYQRVGYEEEQALDWLKLEVVLYDIKHFRLRTIEDFRNYLYSLPIYKNKHQANKPVSIEQSFYARAIQHTID